MTKIKLLDPDLINKIAAGEVIERPASAVKELIENSIDSGATLILIEIGEGGSEYIKCTDNGQGMDEEDARLCIQKHTTSKLETQEDLFKIMTLGFRGEALSSMAAVAKMEIITKKSGNLSGNKLIIENGQIIDSQEAGVPQGTSIEIRDLFYNTPARKNYLKETATEMRHITDIVQKYALSNQEISFKLTHNKNIILNAPYSEDPLAKIISIFGKDFAKELITINVKTETNNIKGYIGKPSLNRSDKSYIITFVNNRFVKNKFLADSVFNAYNTMLNTQRYPVAILHFEFPIDKIDVNVHPSKTIIKIQDESKVSDWITQEIKSLLNKQDLVPRPKIEPKQTPLLSKDILEITPKEKELPQTNMSKLLQKYEKPKHRPVDVKATNQKILNIQKEPEFTPHETIPLQKQSFKILGTIHKTYVLIETLEGLRVVDQHAAHERVQYEKFKRTLESRSLQTQKLLQPINIDISPEEKQVALQYKPQFHGLGFDLEDFGGNTIKVNTLPSILGRQQSIDLFRKCLESFRREGITQNPIEQITENFIATMGCRSAIKAGDKVEDIHILKILEELEDCNNKHTCPHGRPITIEITLKEFEKLFNRERGHESEA